MAEVSEPQQTDNYFTLTALQVSLPTFLPSTTPTMAIVGIKKAISDGQQVDQVDLSNEISALLGIYLDNANDYHLDTLRHVIESVDTDGILPGLRTRSWLDS